MKTNNFRGHMKKGIFFLDFSEKSDTSDIRNNSNIIESRGSFYVQKTVTEQKGFVL